MRTFRAMGFWLSTLSNLLATVGGAFIVGLIGFFLWEPLIKPRALRWVEHASEDMLEEQAMVAVAEVQAEAARAADRVEQATTPEEREMLVGYLRSEEVSEPMRKKLLHDPSQKPRVRRLPERIIWHPDYPHLGINAEPGESYEDASERLRRGDGSTRRP